MARRVPVANKRKGPLTISLFTEKTPVHQLIRSGIDRSVFQAGVRAAANRIGRMWEREVMQSGAKSGFKPLYMRTIRVIHEQKESRVEAEGKFVTFVEEGIRAFDMKPGLLSGQRARFSEDGTPYNIVPFRHGTPGSLRNPMSVAAYAQARQIGPEERYITVGMTQRQNVHGNWVKQRIYRAGAGRVVGTSAPPGTSKKGYRRKTGFEEGMVRAGASRHTQYMTFRAVSAKSKKRSWWYPGLAATPVYPGVNKKAPEVIKKTFAQAVIKALGGVAAAEAGGPA